MKCYHLTNKENISLIVNCGLNPTIGKNSQDVKERTPLLYFTSDLKYIDVWSRRLNIDKSNGVVLKFENDNFVKRYDNVGDFFTEDVIRPKDIYVSINNKDVLLSEYYNQNKKELDLLHFKKIVKQIKGIKEHLDAIKGKGYEIRDEGWDYVEVDPNLLETIELIRDLTFSDYKSYFSNEISEIREATLRELLDKKLGITGNSSLYKTIDYLFGNIYSSDNPFTMCDYTYLAQICCVNMTQLLVQRYKETKKNYGDMYKIWNYDSLDIKDIKILFKYNDCIEELLYDIERKQNNLIQGLKNKR